MLGAFLIGWLPERLRGFAEFRIMVFGAALVAAWRCGRRACGRPGAQRRAAEGTGGLGARAPRYGAAATTSEVKS